MDMVQDNNDKLFQQPKKLQCQCVEVCVRYPVECLQGKPPPSYNATSSVSSTSPPLDGFGLGRGNEGDGGGGGSSGNEATMMEIDMDSVVQSDGYYHDIDLKANCFIPHSVCEELFQRIIKEYPEQYINLFVDTTKCRLTRIDLSTTETKYPLQDFDLISKLYAHPLREINLSGCRALSSSLSSLKNCTSTLQVI